MLLVLLLAAPLGIAAYGVPAASPSSGYGVAAPQAPSYAVAPPPVYVPTFYAPPPPPPPPPVVHHCHHHHFRFHAPTPVLDDAFSGSKNDEILSDPFFVPHGRRERKWHHRYDRKGYKPRHHHHHHHHHYPRVAVYAAPPPPPSYAPASSPSYAYAPPPPVPSSY